jgi:hypothetical protein
MREACITGVFGGHELAIFPHELFGETTGGDYGYLLTEDGSDGKLKAIPAAGST